MKIAMICAADRAKGRMAVRAKCPNRLGRVVAEEVDRLSDLRDRVGE